jgi:hypothetical protein
MAISGNGRRPAPLRPPGSDRSSPVQEATYKSLLESCPSSSVFSLHLSLSLYTMSNVYVRLFYPRPFYVPSLTRSLRSRSLTLRSTTSHLAASPSSFTTTLCPRLLATSASSARARTALATLAQASTASSRNSCCRVVTSPVVTALVASPSTGRSSPVGIAKACAVTCLDTYRDWMWIICR